MDTDRSASSAPESASFVSNQSGAVNDNIFTQKQIALNGDDESDGFLSGDDEFETPSERPIRVYSGEIPAGIRADFVNSEHFYTPAVARPIAKVTTDDADDDDDDDDETLGSGGGGYWDSAEEDTAEKSRIGEVVKESGFSDSHQEFVDDSGGIDSKVFESEGIVAEQNHELSNDTQQETLTSGNSNTHTHWSSISLSLDSFDYRIFIL